MPPVLHTTIGVGLMGCSLAGTQCRALRAAARGVAEAPRDATGQPQKGLRIRGRVVDGASGRGLRRARISITSPDAGAAGRRSASTDLAGRYEIRDLPPARYRVQVTRSGYLPLDYGQRRPGELGRPVGLADGQVLEKIDFALPRMSVITGRISDETGEPMEGVTVLAMRSLFFEGRRKLVPVANASTDDAGEYRLQRLSPATYVVMATTKETWTVMENGKEVVFGYTPTFFPTLRGGAVNEVGQRVPSIDPSLIPGDRRRCRGLRWTREGSRSHA